MADILDSGNRREFSSGAVRDVGEGKGRCDLLPLDVVADILLMRNEQYASEVIRHVDNFVRSGETTSIRQAIVDFSIKIKKWSLPIIFMEVSKHFEDGARKYEERNWEKGILTHCYVDSGVRHFLKFIDGFEDERHDRAFVWNMMCLLWTCEHRPELNDLPYASEDTN